MEFGSGFKIAMRDLEIRGAGNVLGPEQSGFLLSVGYDMYLKLLEEAVTLISQDGLENLSLRRLATQCGVSHNAI